MTFQPGNKLAKGRPKGAVNRRTKEVAELAEELGCNPVEVLINFAKGDWEALGYSKGTKSIYTEAGIIEEDLISPSERIQAAKEVAQYIYSKKKSVEHITRNALEGMSPQEKLEAMREAVKMMEGQIDNPGGLSREVKDS